jgi:AGCS family alanine or glycine:cation symporter
VMKVEAVWSVGDIINAIKIVPNLIGLIGLSGIVARLTKDYFKKRAFAVGSQSSLALEREEK